MPVHLESDGHQSDVEALLDTGFDGDVAVPPDLIGDGRPADGHLRWTLADGSSVLAPYYLGTATVGRLGPFPAVVTALGEEPLAGIGLAKHLTIVLDHGRRLVVEP